MPYYPLGRVFEGYRSRAVIKDTKDGVKILRVWSIPAGNTGRVRRLLSYASFAFVAMLAGLMLPRFDLVIASVPHIGTELAGLMIARAKRSRSLLEMRDAIPDCLELVGVARSSLTARLLRAYYKLVYRSEDFFAVPHHNIGRMIEQSGVAPDRILLLPHAADPELLMQGDRDAVRRRLNIDSKFVVLYAGSFSSYYGLQGLVKALRQLQDHLPHVQLLLLGTGTQRESIEALIRSGKQRNATLLDPVSPEEVGEYLQSADLFITPLVGDKLPVAYRNYLTTKVCEYLMIGRPVIAMESEPVMGPFLEEIGAGRGVRADDPLALGEAIRRYACDAVGAARCGESAGRYARENLLRKRVVEAFEAELMEKLETNRIAEGARI
jgi:glycosyltransferase involved in cell wall biosynthesis